MSNTTPPSALTGAGPFHADAWQQLLGEFDLHTATAPDLAAPGGLRTLLRLWAESDPPRLVGRDAHTDTSAARHRPWPVELRGDTLVIGGVAPEHETSEYRVLWLSPLGFAGEWRTRQPSWLREQQLGHPEFATAPFLATRRSASP